MIQLCREYAASKNKNTDPGFNPFLLISDTFRRENFHSDIIRALLDPVEKHGGGLLYLRLFLEHLNISAAGRLSINYNDFNHARVYRERGRIDILICDDRTMHAVIIENKINGARDMHRQLPRYVEALEQQGYHIDAIVYLLLNYHLKPDTSGWNNDERRMISQKLVVVPVFNDQSSDLVNGWLTACLRNTKDSDAKAVISQYKKLLQWTGEKAMDKQLMEKFYSQMKEQEQFSTALSVRNMINELPLYRLERILDCFRDNCYPFECVRNWQNKAAVFDAFRYQEGSYAVDIIPDQQSYRVQFFDRQSGKVTSGQLLNLIKEAEGFQPAGERLQRTFRFPTEENDLYNFLERFRSKLKVLVETPEV